MSLMPPCWVCHTPGSTATLLGMPYAWVHLVGGTDIELIVGRRTGTFLALDRAAAQQLTPVP